MDLYKAVSSRPFCAALLKADLVFPFEFSTILLDATEKKTQSNKLKKKERCEFKHRPHIAILSHLIPFSLLPECVKSEAALIFITKNEYCILDRGRLEPFLIFLDLIDKYTMSSAGKPVPG